MMLEFDTRLNCFSGNFFGDGGKIGMEFVWPFGAGTLCELASHVSYYITLIN